MKKELNLYLLFGIALGMVVFYFDLTLPYGIAIWLLYLVPILVIFEEYWTPKKLYLLVLFYSILLLAKLVLIQNDDIHLSLNRPLFVLFMLFITYVQVQRKKNYTALTKSEERFHLLADNISQLVWMADEKGNIFWYNKRWFDFTGTTPAEMKNHSFRNFLHPDRSKKTLKKLFKNWQNKEPWEDLFLLKGKDDNYRWFLTRAFPIKNSKDEITKWFGTSTDITDIKNTERELFRSRKQLNEEKDLLQAIIDTVPAMISIYDPNFNNIKLNRAFEKITGWKNTDYEDKDLLELIYPDPEYRKDIVKYMQSLKPGFKDIKMLTKSGKLIETSWANVKIPDGRQVGIGIDISERKYIEQKLLKTMHELERSNQDLEQFAYIVSHDLQAPVRQINGFINILLKKNNNFDSSTNELLGLISSAIIRMGALIKGLLELSKITKNINPFCYFDTNLSVKNALDNIELFIEENDAEIISDELPPVLGDEALITQLFQNLIQNGIKFSDTKKPEIKISSYKTKDETVFFVKDNGIGIDEKSTKHIFDIFHRLDTQEKYEGTGIGLSICKKIVEYHNGRIWVESKPGEGSTFYFTLSAMQ